MGPHLPKNLDATRSESGFGRSDTHVDRGWLARRQIGVGEAQAFSKLAWITKTKLDGCTGRSVVFS